MDVDLCGRRSLKTGHGETAKDGRGSRGWQAATGQLQPRGKKSGRRARRK